MRREANGVIRSKILLLVIIISLSAACATTDNANRADAYYKLGIAYLSENKVQQAFVEFHKAYELNPHNKEILNAIGIVYLLHLEETDKAIEYFERAVKEDPLYSEAFNNLGYGFEKRGDFEKAISYYRKALSNPLYPTAEKAYINMGNSYYRLGNFDAALQSYKEAIKRAPGLGLAYWRLALCLNAMGRYGDASTAVSEAVKLEPAYGGDRGKAIEDLSLKKLKAKGREERDLQDYIEILKY
jgi:Tfp pilus assembly protein PilF